MLGKVRTVFDNLWRDRRGASSLEYGILCLSIVLAIVALYAPTIGSGIQTIFAQVGNGL